MEHDARAAQAARLPTVPQPTGNEATSAKATKPKPIWEGKPLAWDDYLGLEITVHERPASEFKSVLVGFDGTGLFLRDRMRRDRFLPWPEVNRVDLPQLS